METPNSFDFSLEPRFTTFTIAGEKFVLREASEEAYTSYKNLTMRAMRFVGVDGGEKRAQMIGGAEADTQLISKCLFRIKKQHDKEIEDPVPFEVVSAMPRRTTSQMYNWIRTNSGMDEEVETIEFLEKRITSDQQKLAVLRGEGTSGKDEPSSTFNIST